MYYFMSLLYYIAMFLVKIQMYFWLHNKPRYFEINYYYMIQITYELYFILS